MEQLKEFYENYFKQIIISTTIIIVLLSFYLGSVLFSSSQKADTELETSQSVVSVSGTIQETELQGYVDIKGEVRQPGVYRVEKNMRLKDLIDKAGGFTEFANTQQVNLAQMVTDEMVIIIPNQDNEMIIVENNAVENTTAIKINLNTGNKEQLMSIKGIGEKKALLIIEYREKVSKFKTIEDLAAIKGFSSQFIESIRPFIKVNP